MKTVAHQKLIKLSTNTISDIITTGISIIPKEYFDIDHSKHKHMSLMEMSDIVFLDEVSGATLIFDAQSNQFILEPIPVIDGGSF